MPLLALLGRVLDLSTWNELIISLAPFLITTTHSWPTFVLVADPSIQRKPGFPG